jgi:hypothetical protein
LGVDDDASIDLDPFSGDDYGDAIRLVLTELIESNAAELGLGKVTAVDRTLIVQLEHALTHPSEAREAFEICLEHLDARRSRPRAPLALSWSFLDVLDCEALQAKIDDLSADLDPENPVSVVVYLGGPEEPVPENLDQHLSLDVIQEELSALDGVDWVTVRVDRGAFRQQPISVTGAVL